MKLPLALLGSTLIAVSAHAITIDFAGYADGNLNANADWGGGAGNQVVSEEVNLPTSGQFQKNWFETPEAAGQTSYTIGGTFTFDRAAGASLSSRQVVVGFDIADSAAFGATNGSIRLQRDKGNSDDYRLTFNENSAGNSNFYPAGFGFIDEALIGFADGADTTSDLLSLEMTLTRGADETGWSVEASLTNVTTSTVVQTIAPTVFTTTQEFFDNPLYGMINSQSNEANSFTSNRTIETFTLASVPEPSSVALLFGGAALAFAMVRRRS